MSDYGAVYRCVVSNSEGAATSNPATVTVIDDIAPLLTVDGDDTRTTESDTITISGFAEDTGSGLSAVEITNDR